MLSEPRWNVSGWHRTNTWRICASITTDSMDTLVVWYLHLWERPGFKSQLSQLLSAELISLGSNPRYASLILSFNFFIWKIEIKYICIYVHTHTHTQTNKCEKHDHTWRGSQILYLNPMPACELLAIRHDSLSEARERLPRFHRTKATQWSFIMNMFCWLNQNSLCLWGAQCNWTVRQVTKTPSPVW